MYMKLHIITGNDELTQSRLEVATLLAAGDKTHSQLLELMPERSGNAHTRNFETVLKEVKWLFSMTVYLYYTIYITDKVRFNFIIVVYYEE